MANYFYDFIRRNWQLKIISLVLAIMAWYFVMGEEQVEISAPVEVAIEIPDKYVVENGNTQTKYATLRGPRVYLGSLIRQKKLHAKIQTNAPRLGRNRYQIGRSDLVEEIDPRVVIDILDPLIDFDVRNRARKTVPIIERLTGVVKDGYVLEKVVWDPPSVEISGTKEAVKPVNEVEPKAIDIAGKEDSFSEWVDIEPPKDSGVFVRPERVKVTAVIKEMLHRKTFNGIKVRPRDCPDKTRVKPSVVAVEVEGVKSSVESLDEDEILVFASCEGQKDGSFEKRIQVEINGFEGSRVRPEFGVLILGE